MMRGGCGQLFAQRTRSLECFRRSSTTAVKSLNVLLTESTLSEPVPAESEPPPTMTQPKESPLLESAIAKAGTSEKLFKVIQRHACIMTPYNLMDCWLRFDSQVKAGVDMDSLKREPGFDELTKFTGSRLPIIESAVFKPFSFLLRRFKFEADSEIVELTCRELNSRLSDVSLGILVATWTNLKELKGTSPALEVFRLSLPVVFQTRVRTDIDGGCNRTMAEAVEFALTENLDPETIEFVAKTALPNCKGFSTWQSFCIVKSAAGVRETLSGSIREVLSTCLDNLTIYESELAIEHIGPILECCRTHDIGSSILLNFLWRLAPTWPSELKLALLKLRLKLDHISLLENDSAWDLMMENKDQLVGDPDVLKIAEAISLLNFRHKSEPEMQRQLSMFKDFLEAAQARIYDILSDEPHQLAKTLFYLATMGMLPRNLLDKLFDEAFQRSLCSDPVSCEYIVELERFLNMSLGASNCYKVIPEVRALTQNDTARNDASSSLSRALQLGFGGKEFVAESVETPFGTRADYVVAMRGGEYAMGFSAESSDRLKQIPSGSKVVAIILDEGEKGDPSLRILREIQLSLREQHLRAQSFCTLMIDVETLESMRPHARTPFVMKLIKEVAKDGPKYSADALQSSNANGGRS